MQIACNFVLCMRHFNCMRRDLRQMLETCYNCLTQSAKQQLFRCADSENEKNFKPIDIFE